MRKFFLLFFVMLSFGAHAAAPVLETWTQNDGGDTDSTSHVANEPAGVVSGDYLVIIVMSDRSVATAQYSDNLAGWTFEGTAGDDASDSHIGVFTRVSDGTEAATITVTAQGTGDWATYYLRISGVDTGGTPTNAFGAGQSTAYFSTHTIPSITTTVDDSLIIYSLAVDGSSADQHAVGAANGWTGTDELDETSTGTYGTDNLCISFGTKDLVSFGATGDAEMTIRRSAGAAWMQIDIAPAATALLLRRRR